MNPIAQVTIAYLKASYNDYAEHSLDDIIRATEQVASSLFLNSGKAEVYKAVAEITNAMVEDNEKYYFTEVKRDQS